MKLLNRYLCRWFGHQWGVLDWYWDGENHYYRMCHRCDRCQEVRTSVG